MSQAVATVSRLADRSFWVAARFSILAFAGAGVAYGDDPRFTAWQLNDTVRASCCTNICDDPTLDPLDELDTQNCEGMNACVSAWFANVQLLLSTDDDIYVFASGLPRYPVGPFPNDSDSGYNPDAPVGHDWVYQFPRVPEPALGDDQVTNIWSPDGPGPFRAGTIGLWVNGVAIFSPWDAITYPEGNPNAVWHNNAIVVEGPHFDAAFGHPSPDLSADRNDQSDPDDPYDACGYWRATPVLRDLTYGVYHHHQRSPALAAEVGDGAVNPLNPSEMLHSPILGFAFDGYPIYGPYGYANADGTGGVRAMRSSYQLRPDILLTGLRHEQPPGTVLDVSLRGPTTSDVNPATGAVYVAGYFLEDYVYINGPAELDKHNGRECVTPEFPTPTYAYFTPIDPSTGENAFPYSIGSTYFGMVETSNFPLMGRSASQVTVPSPTELYLADGCEFEPWIYTQVLTAQSDAHADAYFGSDVAADQQIAIVGAPQQTIGAAQPGAAFVFRQTEFWNRDYVHTRSPIPATDLRIGRSVALDADGVERFITGDETLDPVGAACLFAHTGVWGAFADPVLGGLPNDNFGHQVAIEGDTAVITASMGQLLSLQTGAALFLRYGGGVWAVERQEYGDFDGALFGDSVAIDAGRVVIGSPGAGEAYVYEYVGTPPSGNWTRTHTFGPSSAGEDKFGFSVAIQDDRLVIGSPEIAGGDERAYVYRFESGCNSWILDSTLHASDATPESGVQRPAFGWSVAVDQRTIVIGAPQHGSIPSQPGVAYVYELCNGFWQESERLFLSGGAADDGYARRVATNGDCVFVAAPFADSTTPALVNSGAVHVYCNPRELTTVWQCGDGLWSSTNCWSSLIQGDEYPDLSEITYRVLLPDIPTSNYKVTVDPPLDPVIQLPGPFEMPGALTELEVLAGNTFQFDGSVVVRGALIAQGGSIVAGPQAVVDADQAGLAAWTQNGSPGLIELPIATYTDTPGLPARTFRADGAGSRIHLPNLVSLAGNVQVNVSHGGRLDLPSLVSFQTTEFTVEDAGSVLNVPQVTVLLPGGDFEVLDGGRIDAGPLTAIDTAELRVSGATSFIDVSQIAIIDRAVIRAQNGAQLTFPLVTSFLGTVSRIEVLAAQGGSALLEFPALVSVDGAGHGMGISATNSGIVRLPALTSVRNAGISVEDSGSTVELGSLAMLDGPGITVSVASGGTLVTAPLTALLGVNLFFVSGPTSFVDVSQVQSIDRSNVELRGGAIVRFPLVTSYTSAASTGINSLYARGAGSVLDLNAMTAVTCMALHQLGLGVDFAGGRFEARNLQSMTGARIAIQAEGNGSTCELGMVNLAPQGGIAVNSGGRLIVRTDFTYAMTASSQFAFVAPATLQLDGGQTGEECSEFEVAGQDRGNVPNGWTANFQLDRLVVGPGAHIRLVDAINNGRRNGPAGAAEALYVNTIEFADLAGRIDTDGKRLYVLNVIGNAGQIISGQCSCPTDTNEDAEIDLSDLSRVLAMFGVCAGDPSYSALLDFDGSGCIDLGDLSRLLARFGATCE
ncbi:MAG: YHYH protein [Phycisphaerae bacterium]